MTDNDKHLFRIPNLLIIMGPSARCTNVVNVARGPRFQVTLAGSLMLAKNWPS